MRSYFNKLSILIVLVSAMITLPVQASSASLPASGTSCSNYEKAVDLKVLGLFANKPDDFELDRAPTRAEGAVMLVRMLGKEYQVKQGSYSHPFTDVPAWADDYVGYIYQNGIANGVSDDLFGSSRLISAAQYVTFVLRSMGYKDNADFSYASVLDKARELSLLTSAELTDLKNKDNFLRNDLVAVSHNALSVKMKGSSQTLIEKLVDSDKAIFKPAAIALNLYPSDFEKHYGNAALFNPSSTKDGYVINNKTDLVKIVTKMLLNNNTVTNIDISGYEGNIVDEYESAFKVATKAAEEITGVNDFVQKWGYTHSSRTMELGFTYRYEKAEYANRKSKVNAAIKKGRYIVADIINMDMSEFDKEILMHDYIVNNTKYDYGNYTNDTLSEDAFEEYGSLLSGYAVCEGYAETMKLLCDLSGIECMIVTGKTNSSGRIEGHAWNIVKIDGDYYHIDCTNDDPVTKDGSQILTYCYFNLTDDEMMKACTWNQTAYPVCASIKNSYYYKYNKVADNREAFDRALAEELGKRSSVIELKVADYSKSTYSNLSDQIFKTKMVLKYKYTVNDDFGIIRIFNIKYS